MLDVFCGLGGVSDGFALEGFDVVGVDVEDMVSKGYKHKFIQRDVREFYGGVSSFDVVWGSPPCRDFCLFAKRFGSTWKKNPPDPVKGMELVDAFLNLAERVRPKFWIMENVPELAKYYREPVFTANLRGERQMVRSFWGYFPSVLIPRDNRNVVMRYRPECNSKDQVLVRREDRAKIPLVVSRAFARACKELLV